MGAGAAVDDGADTESLGAGAGVLQATKAQQAKSPRAAVRRPDTITVE